MRIACWSGPRNISTALMRSWSSRSDLFVSDEPFYAYYLKERQLKHPMSKEIIAHYPNVYDDVVASLICQIPNDKEHWYNNVITTTHFQKFSANQSDLDKKYQSIYDEALDYYNELYYFAEQ